MGFQDSFNGAFSALSGVQRQSALTRAGQAYEAGDQAGVRSALAGGGLVQEAMAYDRDVADDARRDQASAAADVERQRATIIAGAQGLRFLPQDQRWAAYQTRVLPILQRERVDPSLVSGITAENMTDADLDQVITAFGGEADLGTIQNAGSGRLVRVDPYTREVTEVYAAPEEDPTAPAGYRWTADNALEAIPGGPADPAQAGRVAASRRAPPRARGGGGGGRSSSTAPASAPRSAGNPWDRDY